MHTIKKFAYAFLIVATHIASATQLMMGTIQFPHELNGVPPMRVYCGGRKVSCQTDTESKKTTFTVSQEASKYEPTKAYIVVTQDFSAHTMRLDGQQVNTIDHLSVQPNTHYKMFELTLNTPNEEDQQESLRWDVAQIDLPEDGRLPDSAIIVYYDPQYISVASGGNKLELPTICVHGSQDTLFDSSTKFLLSALNLDAFHAPAEEQKIKFQDGRTLVAPTA